MRPLSVQRMWRSEPLLQRRRLPVHRCDPDGRSWQRLPAGGGTPCTLQHIVLATAEQLQAEAKGVPAADLQLLMHLGRLHALENR